MTALPSPVVEQGLMRRPPYKRKIPLLEDGIGCSLAYEAEHMDLDELRRKVRKYEQFQHDLEGAHWTHRYAMSWWHWVISDTTYHVYCPILKSREKKGLVAVMHG